MSVIRPKRKIFITNSMDVLLTIILFYNFSNWVKYDSLPTQLLGLFACLFALNDWMIVRETYEIYGTAMFIIDVLVCFCFANFPGSLVSHNGPWGYDPRFWLFVAIIEALYGTWDIFVSQISPIEKRQRTLSIWSKLSFVSVAMAVITFVTHIIFSQNMLFGRIMEGMTALFISGMIVVWNLERYKLAREANLPFIT